MSHKDAAKLERLLCELADEGASRELVEKIEAMLLDQPELQDHYWSWMDVHVALGVERTAILGESESVSQLASLPEFGKNQEAYGTQSVGRGMESPYLRWLHSALVVAACLGLVFLASPEDFWKHSATHPNRDSAFATIQGTWRIPRITRVSWEGPLFADPEHADNSESPMRTGLVSLGIVDGISANGYILRLEPRASAELMMAADAYAENNLSVTELDSDGTPLLRSVSFNNYNASVITPVDTDFRSTHRKGLLGTWSVYNASDKPKHYLLNGIHKVEDPGASESESNSEFRLSNMAVLLDEPDVILIGWDDGGIDPIDDDEARVIHADGDYDDITVLIRITHDGNVQTKSHEPRLIVSSLSGQPETPRTDGSINHQFVLLPGEVTALKVASHADFTNALFLVNAETDEVLWSTKNVRPGTMNLGAVAVHNTGDRMMKLAILCENSGTSQNGDAQWKCSEMAIIQEHPSCTIIGFEDLGEGGDFDDIKVTMFSVSSSRTNLIESLEDSFDDQATDESPIGLR